VSLQTVSRYPFRSEAQEWIRERGVSLADVLTGQAYRQVVEEGRDRVLEAMTEDGIHDRTAYDDARAIIAVLSYPIARMLVSSVGDILLVRRYALKEAKSAYGHLVGEDAGFLLELAEEELDLPAELVEDAEEETVRLHFSDYLKNASSIRHKPWKLHNQDLREGYVHLPKRRFARLLQEAIRKRIEDELPLEVNDAILAQLSDEIDVVVQGVERLRESIQKESYGEFSLEYLPPCMMDLLTKTQQGVNVPHMGRFALTAFLSHVGLDAEDILNLFRASSDFKESVASYQVHHILGDISGTRYTPPSCSTMQTYGLCLKDKSCERVGSPRYYYFRRQRRAERQSGRQTPPPETEEEAEKEAEKEAKKEDGEVGDDA
jgi:DNA primase large subunit